MQFDLLSWGIGIPTGISVNWLSMWLYNRFWRKRRTRGDYFTATYSGGDIDFEGRVKTRISVEEIFQNLLKSVPKAEHKEAARRLRQRKTGLMNYQGKIIKPSTRK